MASGRSAGRGRGAQAVGPRLIRRSDYPAAGGAQHALIYTAAAPAGFAERLDRAILAAVEQVAEEWCASQEAPEDPSQPAVPPLPPVQPAPRAPLERPTPEQPSADPPPARGASPARRYYTPKEAAQILHVSPKTLAKWRGTGEGPPFHKIGRKIAYRHDDLAAFAQARGSPKGPLAVSARTAKEPAALDVDGERFLRPRDAAEFLRVSDKTLAKWRIRGGGPAYYKIASRIAYRAADLEAFASRRLNTSDDGTYGAGRH